MSATSGGNRSPTTTSTHCTRRASRTLCSTSTGGRRSSGTAWAGSAPLRPITRPTPPMPRWATPGRLRQRGLGRRGPRLRRRHRRRRNDLGRTGIGRGLVSVAERESRAAGCEWLHVDFEEDLRGFYLGACGFRRRRPASSRCAEHERPYPFGVLFLGIAAPRGRDRRRRVAPTTTGTAPPAAQSNSYQSGICRRRPSTRGSMQ